MSLTDNEETKEAEAPNARARVVPAASRTAIVLPRLFEAHKNDFWNFVNVRLPQDKCVQAFRRAMGWNPSDWLSRQNAMRELLERLGLFENEPLKKPTETRKKKRLYKCLSWRTDLTLLSREKCPWKPTRAWQVACRCMFNRCRYCGWAQYAYYPEVLWWAHLVWNADDDKFPRNAAPYATLAHSLEMLERYSEGLATSLLMDATGQLLMQPAQQQQHPHELQPLAWLEQEHRGVAQGFLNAARDGELQHRELLDILINHEEKQLADGRFPLPRDDAEMPVDVSFDVRVRRQSVPCSAHTLFLNRRRLLLDEVLTSLQPYVELRDSKTLFQRARQRAQSAVRMWWDYSWPRDEPEFLAPDAFWNDYDLVPDPDEPNRTLVVELCWDEPPVVVGLPGGAKGDPADLQSLTEDAKMPGDDEAAMRPVRSRARLEPRDGLGNVLSSSFSSSVSSGSPLDASHEPQPPLAASSTLPSMPIPPSGWSPSRAGPGHRPTAPRSAGKAKQPVNTDFAAQLQAHLQHREARGDITYSRAYYSRAIVLRRLCQTKNAVHRTVEEDVDRALKMSPPPSRAREIKEYIELLKRQQREEEERREQHQGIRQSTTAVVNGEVSSKDEDDSDDQSDDSSEDECFNELRGFLEGAVRPALHDMVPGFFDLLVDEAGVRCMDDLAVLTWRIQSGEPTLYVLTDPETRRPLLPTQRPHLALTHSIIIKIDQHNKQQAARHVYLHPWHRQVLSSAALTPSDERFITQLLHELYGCLVEGEKPAAHRQLTTRWLLDAKLEEKKVGKAKEAAEEDGDNSWLAQLVAAATTSVTPLLPQLPIVLAPDKPSRAETALVRLISDLPRFRRYTALSQRRLLVMVMELLYVYSSVYIRQRQDPHEALTALAPALTRTPYKEAVIIDQRGRLAACAYGGHHSNPQRLYCWTIPETATEDRDGSKSHIREHYRDHHPERFRELWHDAVSPSAGAGDNRAGPPPPRDENSDTGAGGDLHDGPNKAGTGAGAYAFGGSKYQLLTTPPSGSVQLQRRGGNASAGTALLFPH